jgi:hypothetical protein
VERGDDRGATEPVLSDGLALGEEHEALAERLLAALLRGGRAGVDAGVVRLCGGVAQNFRSRRTQCLV